MYPECEEIMRLAPDYHIIPVCKRDLCRCYHTDHASSQDCGGE